MYEFDRRMQKTDEKIIDFEDKTIKITQSENREKLDWKKMNRASETCSTITKDLTFFFFFCMRVLEGEEKELSYKCS